MQNFSILACLEIPEKFVVVVVVGGGAGGVKILPRPSLGFSFSQAEQNSFGLIHFNYFFDISIHHIIEYMIYC